MSKHYFDIGQTANNLMALQCLSMSKFDIPFYMLTKLYSDTETTCNMLILPKVFVTNFQNSTVDTFINKSLLIWDSSYTIYVSYTSFMTRYSVIKEKHINLFGLISLLYASFIQVWCTPSPFQPPRPISTEISLLQRRYMI